MADRPTQRLWWRTFSVVLLGVLMLSLVAACGSDDDDDTDTDTDSGTTSTATTATGSSSGTTAAATSTEADDTSGTATTSGSDMDDAMAIGACFEENTTAAVVDDLRAGETESAEEVYRACLEEELPPELVSQLDPIIEEAAECGSDSAADLSDEDVAAIEGGDQAVIEQLTTDTLDCVSTELGIDLQ